MYLSLKSNARKTTLFLVQGVADKKIAISYYTFELAEAHFKFINHHPVLGNAKAVTYS